MSGHEARTNWEGWGLLLLWTSFFLAPLAWAFDQSLSYALVKWVCATGHKNVLTVISLAALAMTGAGGRLGWVQLQRLRDAREDGGRQPDRSYFLAVVAIGFNVLIALLIVTAAVPRFILSPCE
jgi:hypothetical protein